MVSFPTFEGSENGFVTVIACPSSEFLQGLYQIIFLLLLAGASVSSYYTKNIPGLYSEAYFVMLATYHAFVLFLVTSITIATTEVSFANQELILCIGFAWVTVSCALMIVGSRALGKFKPGKFTSLLYS